MEDINFLTILFDILITVILYCFLPFIIRIFCGRQEKNKAIKIVVINSIAIYLLYILLMISTKSENVPNISPAIIWGLVSYKFLKKNNDDTIFDTFPKVLPAYANNKKLSHLYLEELTNIIENEKLIGKINPYTNTEIKDFDDIKEYYKQYVNDNIDNQ